MFNVVSVDDTITVYGECKDARNDMTFIVIELTVTDCPSR
jgi:hypothetical protein